MAEHKPFKAVLSRRLELLPPYSLLVVGQWKDAALAAGREIFDFSLGDPKEETPAFIRERLVKSVSPSSSYPLALGTLGLRQAASSWLQRRLGLSVPEGNVVPTSGSKEAIFHFAQVLEPGLGVAFPSPGYPVYEGAALMAGQRPIPLELRPEHDFGWHRSLVNQRSGEIAALWVCSPHNPTGTVLSKEQMLDVIQWCRDEGVLLLSDECYIDSFDPGSVRPLSFLELAKDHGFAGVVAFFTLSKRSGMTGYRSGFVTGDPRYIEAFKKLRPHAGLASPSFVQEAATVAWFDDDHVAQRAQIFAAKRRRVVEFLNQLGWRSVPSNATFYVWAKLPDGYPPARAYLQNLVLETGIVATPGDCFGANRYASQWFRLALVPSLSDLDRACALWCEYEKRKGEHNG
jgi:aspartate/methionine/tyrosine aminotransferase